LFGKIIYADLYFLKELFGEKIVKIVKNDKNFNGKNKVVI